MSTAPTDPPVVVTGLGAVTAYGWGIAPLWRGLSAGRAAFGELTTVPAAGARSRVASEVPPPDGELAATLAATVTGWSRLGRAARFAVAAAREALADAGLETPLAAALAPRVGVFFASTAGGTLEGEAYLAGLLGRGPRRPLWTVAAPEADAPGDAVARAAGVAGPVETVSSACAASTLSLAVALDALRDGEVDVAVVGGADALCRLTVGGFNALRAVDPGPCRPFRANRAGMSLGEGAAVLVLERRDDARRRGARARAVLRGAGASCDAHHVTAPDPTGEGPAAAIVAALADAGMEPGDVDFVNAHGTGTPQNDAAETRALERVFGDRLASMPLTSTKGAIGHLLGGAGAVEAVATVLGVAAGEVHPTPGDEPADPALPVDLVLGAPRRDDALRVGLSTSLAFGGFDAAVVFARAEETR